MTEHRGARSRSARHGSRPTLTVVLLSSGDTGALGAAVAALQRQCTATACELVIARTATPGEAAALTRAYPFARIVAAPPGSSDEDLRVLAMSEAGGDIIAFTSDRVVVPERWIEALRVASAGGETDPATDEMPGSGDLRFGD
jgi:hypothetical protein